MKQPKILKKSNRQIGKSNLPIDKKRSALSPGKRLSKNGNEYYEYRKNRSDLTLDRKVPVKKHTRKEGEIDVKKHDRTIKTKPTVSGSQMKLDRYLVKDKGKTWDNCQYCGEKNKSQQLFSYVDGNNKAITKNSPTLCKTCYQKTYSVKINDKPSFTKQNALIEYMNLKYARILGNHTLDMLEDMIKSGILKTPDEIDKQAKKRMLSQDDKSKIKNYELKKQRFEERKQGKLDAAYRKFEKNKQIAEANAPHNVLGERNTGIPFGQPILVGHHS